jgi:kynurenine formamidase
MHTKHLDEHLPICVGSVTMSVSAAHGQVSLAEFEEIFERVKNWGRWGAADRLGTLNYITADRVVAAAKLVRTGRRVSLAYPIDKVAGPDNPNPAVHLMVEGHDVPLDQSGLRFATDHLAVSCHGDCHSHVDALCHVSWNGLVYNGVAAQEAVRSNGATTLDVGDYSEGLVGRGVLVDVPRMRGVPWLEPGEAVTRAELEACVAELGVDVGEGDILVFRTGHFRRRRELGAWDVSPAGQGKAGLHVDTVPWMNERRIAAFLPDGDGEAVPSTVKGVTYPVHPLQIVAMGMLAADSLYLEDLADACQQEARWEFMVVGLPLRLPGGTGSPWNPIAIF